MKICIIDGCDKDGKLKGMCNVHYQRVRRHGSPDSKHGVIKTCKIEGCPNKTHAHDMCHMHCKRVQKYGDAGTAERLVAKSGEGTVNNYGYRMIQKNGVVNGEHRIVMEEFLGRPLLKNENVHHINGNRLDNRIENLELWSKSQPAGQRVEDKVRWAIEILQQYKPEILNE